MGGLAHIVDTGEFPTSLVLTTSFGNENFATLRLSDGTLVDTRATSGIWWRRPGRPSLERVVAHPGLEQVSQEECLQALFGSLVALIPNAFNILAKGKEASDKPLQIFKARQNGLNVPETLITTDPDQAELFFERLNGRVIYKMLRPPRTGRYETRRLAREDLSELWRIRTCPVFLQEYVEGEFDIRATVVGEKIFCARIDYDANHALIDTRFTRTGISAYELDDATAQALISLTKSLGLIYSTSDLRATRDGSILFFELNPDGQYLWTEIETNLQISHEIAKRLCGQLD